MYVGDGALQRATCGNTNHIGSSTTFSICLNIKLQLIQNQPQNTSHNLKLFAISVKPINLERRHA